MAEPGSGPGSGPGVGVGAGAGARTGAGAKWAEARVKWTRVKWAGAWG